MLGETMLAVSMALVNKYVLLALSGGTVFVVLSVTAVEDTLLQFPALPEKYICIFFPESARGLATSEHTHTHTPEDPRGPATFLLSRKLVLVR